jgi:cell division protein FtsB
MTLRHKIILAIAAVVMLNLLLVIVFADNGFLEMGRAGAQRDRMVYENERLTKENLRLYHTIDRLKNDHVYIENIARHELGMVAENELIFKSTPSKGDPP